MLTSRLLALLDRLNRELGNAPDEALPQVLTRLQSFALARLEGLDFGACGEPCLELAASLDAVAQAAATLSDRLAMRYFTHIGDVGRQTLAA